MKIVVPIVAVLAVVLAGGGFLGYMAFTGELAYAGEALEVGKPVPDWTLKDTEGNEHSKEDFAGKVVVYNFCSQQCPFSRGADPAIDALARKYKDKGVVFLGVDSHKSTTPEEIQAHREEKDISYPILKDPGNEFADAVGAKVTPELYITDKDGILRYHGAPDNRKSPEGDPTETYADDALAALVAGETVDPDRTKAWGCGIKRAS
jgi:peroxiredoxin